MKKKVKKTKTIKKIIRKKIEKKVRKKIGKRIIKKIYLILTLIILLFSLFYYKNKYTDVYTTVVKNINDDVLSIIINMKYLTKERNLLFYEFMKQLNTTRKYYFIKTLEKILDENLTSFVVDDTIKIVQSNFPDSIYLPLVVSLYGNNIPENVLFIEAEDINDNNINELTHWFNLTFKKLIINNYDYIFGNSQIIDGKKIGCSLLLSKSSVIQHLLYYTNSDTTHINPFIQLSLATATKFKIIPLEKIKTSNLENIHGSFSINMDCPSINDNIQPSICTILPAFKRDYFLESMPSYSNQTYKTKFYVFLQNDNRRHFNLSLIQSFVDVPVYHIWMRNWNSFFFLNHRLSALFPCDFVMKYDDDQWPIDNTLQEKLVNNSKNENVIIGGRGLLINQFYCELRPRKFKNINSDVVDHSATPFLIRPGYFKVDARTKVFRLYHAEDMSLSTHCNRLCNVTSKIMYMKLIDKSYDGKNREGDKEFKSLYKKEKEPKFNIFKNSYCYLIRAGYMPKRYVDFILSENLFINTTIEHKKLF